MLCTFVVHVKKLPFPYLTCNYSILAYGSDNTLPIFTWTLHISHLNKGCYGMLHTPLKCNLVNFDIPNGFLYYGNPSFIQVRYVQRLGKNRKSII